MRRCSRSCHGECGAPLGLVPRSLGGNPEITFSKFRWAHHRPGDKGDGPAMPCWSLPWISPLDNFSLAGLLKDSSVLPQPNSLFFTTAIPPSSTRRGNSPPLRGRVWLVSVGLMWHTFRGRHAESVRYHSKQSRRIAVFVRP